MKPAFYITTAIPYLNGKPHIGHALEFVIADTIARYMKLKEHDVRLHTGTDENGSKMLETAEKQGMTAQELADQNVEYFKDLLKKLNCIPESFIRTSAPEHHQGAKAMWQKLEAAGDIYKKEYEGLYCVGCEAFLQEKDLVEGLCPIHKKAPIKVKEENYFFRLSKYTEPITQLIESGDFGIEPESRRNEIMALLKDGLHDVSFSRPKSVLPWGVEVPSDPDHVMYVWCDALSNYVNALGLGAATTKDLETYWPAAVQVIGKDILRFHAAIWIGMLLSAQMPTPKKLVVHGFINSGGHKMSKSLGNVIDPFAELEAYGVDPVRYYLLREIPTLADGDYNHQRFAEIYNTELANNLGNVVSRTIAMLHKYNEGKISKVELTPSQKEVKLDTVKAYEEAINQPNIKKAIEQVLKLLQFINQELDHSQPWKVAKENPEQAITLLSQMIELIKTAAVLLLPCIPQSAEAILSQLQIMYSQQNWTELLDTPIDHTQALSKVGALFPRLEKPEL